MRKTYFLAIIMVLLLSAIDARSQQAPQFTQYMFNSMYYNPAYAGVEGVTKMTALFRSQWTGYTPTLDEGGAPVTEVITMSTPIFRFQSGFGAYIVNDKTGPLTSLEVQLAYAYHLAIKNSKLSFGVNAGLFSQSINFSKYRPANQGDPLLPEGQESQLRPDLGLGVYYRSPKYFVGVGFSHVLRAEFDFGTDGLRNALPTNMTLTGGYDYELTYNIIVTPTLLFKSDFNRYSFDLSVIGTYNDKMWGGLSYRQGDAAAIILGYSLFKDNTLKLGYSFDYVVHNQDAKQPTSHEIMLSYALPVNSFGGKKVVRTPRFRH